MTRHAAGTTRNDAIPRRWHDQHQPPAKSRASAAYA